jgi:predicted DNA-binding protein
MISVRLGDDIENRLNYLAQEQHVSKSKIIKDSLLYYFDMIKDRQQAQTPYEIGSELFGRYASGDSERSTTYKQRLKDKISAKNNN